MSASAERRYRDLVRELWLARALAGGDDLSQDEEAERAEELDLCWEEMTTEERAAMEQELRRPHALRPHSVDAPEAPPEPPVGGVARSSAGLAMARLADCFGIDLRLPVPAGARGAGQGAGSTERTRCLGEASDFIRVKKSGRLCPLCVPCKENFERAFNSLKEAETKNQDKPAHTDWGYEVVSLSDSSIEEFEKQPEKSAVQESSDIGNETP